MLAGGPGDDILSGTQLDGFDAGTGDTFFGQGGADRFIVGSGPSWIMDYEPGVDRIESEMEGPGWSGWYQVGAHAANDFAQGTVFVAWTTVDDLLA